jgi:endonuclease YncB( thermonuclease family)
MKWILTLVLAALATGAGARTPNRDWQTLDNCRLLDNPSNDGDSFHVQHNGQEFIFRLYFVDAPETDADFPDRVAEQAAYFGISDKRAQNTGQLAARFSARALTGRFTVLTRWDNALGRSKLPRHYAILLVNGRSLAELLVENGLARIHGQNVELPDGTKPARTEQKLETLERRAKSQQLGAWSYTQTTPAKTLPTLTLPAR